MQVSQGEGEKTFKVDYPVSIFARCISKPTMLLHDLNIISIGLAGLVWDKSY